MSATFDPALPTNRDFIRRRIFDCELADPSEAGEVVNPILQDETIDALLAAYTFNEALAQSAEAAIAYLSRFPDRFKQRGEGGAEVQWTERIDALRAIIKGARPDDQAEAPNARHRRGIAIAPLAEDPQAKYLRTD